MKVSLKWLVSYVNLTLPVAELARRLTLATAEVEAIETAGGSWDHVHIGRVLEVAPHPNADRLRLATVATGDATRTVVCGAPNLAVGQKIAFADVGAHLIDGHTGQPSVLKASTIRGVVSAGMVCSERELGLSDEHEGILVLPEDAPVGAALQEYLGDTILDLYSWPHRPDLMSMIGVAREVAALTGETAQEPLIAFDTAAGPLADRIKVQIEAADLCPRYIGALVENVHVGESPDWMQDRLRAAGMRPVNNVVDITNYVMLEMGQPLHAFDYDHVAGGEIIVRRARSGERLRTLDGEDRVLDEKMLVIADSGAPVALAGVMGGEVSEVSPATTRVLLEAANFNGINIRATSTRLHLRSEASARFEKSISPEVAMHAARRAVQLLVDLCGGRAADGFADVYPGIAPVTVVQVTPDRIQRVLGSDPGRDAVQRALGSLGFLVETGPLGVHRVTVPYWRTDIRLPDDVIEEIVRIVGYDTLPLTTISGRIPERRPEPFYELRRRTQDALVAAGMQEVISYSLVSAELAGAGDSGSGNGLRIVNPSSVEHVYLRRSLRPSLLQTLAANLRHLRARIALFETARVFLPRSGDLPEEVETVAGVLAGRRIDRWGMPAAESVDFYDAKGIVEALLGKLRVAATFRAAVDEALVAGRTAEIVSGDAVLGVLGQVHPATAALFDIGEDAYLFELRLDALLPVLGTRTGYRPFSRYPATEQDIAIVVEQAVDAAQIEAILRQGRFVVGVRPFDVYTGAPIEPGKKSVAFSVQYQAADHTLTDEEVNRSRNRTLQQLRQQLGASLRES